MIGPSRVLLVDDRPENRLALRATLDPLGVHCIEAASGEDALRVLLREDVALILLDVQLPGIDGLETATHIRRRPRTRDVPIIFLTASHAAIERLPAGYEAGAVDFLLKPFDPLVLRSKVEVFARLDRQRRELAQSEALARQAFDAASDGLALVGADGVVLRANAALDRLAGAPSAGRPVLELVPERDRPRLQEALAAARNGASLAAMPSLLGGRVQAAVAVVPLGGDGEAELLLQVEDERDRRTASTLQRALLPERLPECPGVALGAHLSPGATATLVGGDWYDVLPLPGGRVGIVVGDVAGRGVEAAARMGELRSVARAYCLEGHGPQAVVERMNGYHAALGADLMTTFFCGLLDVDRGTLRYVNAGHPPPVLATEGATTMVAGVGPPLGVNETWRYAEEHVEVPVGGVLACYTDGLIERRGRGLDAGLARLREVLEAPADGAAAVCAALVDALGRDADDDVTVLVLERLPVLGPRMRMSLTPDREALTAARRVLRRWLGEAGADAEEAADLVMAANEAWENALEHGTAFAPAAVQVELEVREGELRIATTDAGTRDRAASDPDRGRGIGLMRALADDVLLDLSPHGSRVVLRRRMRPAPAPADVREAERSAT